MPEGAERYKPLSLQEQVKSSFLEGAVATSLEEVPSLLEAGSHVVFYEDTGSVDSRIFEEVFGSITDIDKSFTGYDAIERLEKEFEGHLHATELKEKIVGDIQNILRIFPKKRLRALLLRSFRWPSARGIGPGPWHADDVPVRVLKTYAGPATEYSLSSGGEVVLSPPTGTTTFHTRKARHRRPAMAIGTYRAQILIDLV
ncbi:MAG: DUF1826 domain-containing protein [Patescibacteria group bacterium]